MKGASAGVIGGQDELAEELISPESKVPKKYRGVHRNTGVSLKGLLMTTDRTI